MGVMEQLKGLFLEALPTVVLVFIFYFFLRSQFFGPLMRALEERARRMVGARREAEESISAAKKARQEYEAALHKARLEFYAEQEAERRKALDARMALLHAAREHATAFVRAQKAVLDEEVMVARKQLGHESTEMGGEIARILLAGRGPSSRPEAREPGGAP
jgi:F0F1-type ATP synthase membrane subunit b/b'